MSQFALLLKQLWLTLRSKPWFVVAYSLFLGSLADQLNAMHASGHMDFTVKGLEQMALVAGGAAAWGVIHLLTPPPGTNPNPTK